MGDLGETLVIFWRDFMEILKRNFKGNFKDLDIWSDAVALKKNLQEFGIFNYFKIINLVKIQANFLINTRTQPKLTE